MRDRENTTEKIRYQSLFSPQKSTDKSKHLFSIENMFRIYSIVLN